MGFGVKTYESSPLEILASVSLATPQTTSIVKLGLPSDEDNHGFAGVEIHYQLTPGAGSVNSGVNVDFFLSFDGTEVDDATGVGNTPSQLVILAADIGSSGVYHQTKQYRMEDIGSSVRLTLTKFDGNRAVVAVVYARRWRWKEIIG